MTSETFEEDKSFSPSASIKDQEMVEKTSVFEVRKDFSTLI